MAHRIFNNHQFITTPAQKMTKGVGRTGCRNDKAHVICRRCGKSSYHVQRKRCASCSYPAKSMRRCKCYLNGQHQPFPFHWARSLETVRLHVRLKRQDFIRCAALLVRCLASAESPAAAEPRRPSLPQRFGVSGTVPRPHSPRTRRSLDESRSNGPPIMRSRCCRAWDSGS